MSKLTVEQVTELPDIHISSELLSDLFFNSRLENYHAASENGEDLEDALRQDAIEFADMLCMPELRDALVADFINRI